MPAGIHLFRVNIEKLEQAVKKFIASSVISLLRNYCSLIDPIVYWCFYKVLFESISLFWKYSNKL